MHSRLLLGTLVALTAAATLTAQNFVKNGDFSADLANWSGSGPGGLPGIDSQDVTGLGAGKCFSVYPGGNTYNPPHAPYILKQSVLALPTVMEFRMDVRLEHGNTVNNAQGGIIDVKLGSQTIGTWQRFAGTITPGLYRDQLCFRVLSTQAGTQELAIEMSRPKYTWGGLNVTPLMSIDNISLRVAVDPIIGMTGERKEGGPGNLVVYGQPSAAVALFVAPRLLPAPVPIPGWSGGLELDPSTWLFVLAAVLDGSGELKGTFTVPVGIGGIPLYWQGAQVTTTGQTIGNLAPINFYK